MGADQIRPEEVINGFAKARRGAGNIAGGVGILALLWSTVVLLGGFVSVLKVKDFWYLTVLSFIMASKMVTLMDTKNPEIYIPEREIARGMRACNIPLGSHVMLTLAGPKYIFILCVGTIFAYSPFVCSAISVMRLVQRDYGDAGGDAANKAKLDAALDIFYVLVLIQTSFLIYWLLLNGLQLCDLVSRRCGFGDWGSELVVTYHLATQANCSDDVPLPKDWNLITYGVGLLESASLDDRLSGARVIDTFIQQDIVVRRELLSSTQSIQNLMAMTESTSNVHSSEIRERSARIVAHLASDILTTQFPGVLQCACSLLESHKQYVHVDVEVIHPSASTEQSPWRWVVVLFYRMQCISVTEYPYTFVPKGTKELISQGLLILERLTQQQDNCTAICKHPRLLNKITSPILSYQDFNSNAYDKTWVEMLTRSLTVLSRLVISPGDVPLRLRHEISCNSVAVRNLMGILESGSEGDRELREQALEILTELAFDGSFRKQTFAESSTNGSMMEKFIQILESILFEGEDSSAVVANQDRLKHKRLTRKATETLARLLAIPSAVGTTDALNSAANGNGNVIDRHLNEDVSKILTKVLHKILSCKTEAAAKAAAEDDASNGSGVETAAENKPPPQDTDSLQHSTQETEEQSEERKLIEAMLSLVVVTCTKYVVSEADFARAAPEDAALVQKLKEIIQINQDAKPDCLRIVKLSCQAVITISRLKPNCINDFNEHSFEEVLSEALKNLSGLDTYMLFAGDDRDVTKPVMSLPSLVKEAQRALQRSI